MQKINRNGRNQLGQNEKYSYFKKYNLKKRMFGAICFMIDDKMSFGTTK